MGNYSFEIATAHDLYCKLKREHTKYQASPTDSDLAWNCAVTAWHLREWVWEERLSSNVGEDMKLFGVRFDTEQAYNTELNQRCPKYKLLRDVCNGSKHFRLDYPGAVSSTGTRPGAVLGKMMLGEVALGTVPYLAIFLDDGSIVPFGDVLGQVMSLWDDVFRSDPCA